MTVRIVLEITDALYQRAMAVAQTSQRSTASVLADAIILDEPAEPSTQATVWPGWDEAIEREIAAYHRLHAELRQTYPEQYVAFYQQQFVDHDPLLELLYARVRQKYPGEIVLIRQVQAEAEPVVRL